MEAPAPFWSHRTSQPDVTETPNAMVPSMTPRVHVAFSVSAGQVVAMALAKMGSDERVISLEDDLGYGPIEPYDVDARADFQRAAFMFEPSLDDRARVRAFWDQVTAPDVEHVLWMSRRCVRELTGYMEWLSRCTTPPLVLDIATVDVGPPHPRYGAARSVGELNPERLAECRALGHVTRLLATTFEADRRTWTEQKRRNAALRILDESGLIPAKITYFDSLLLSCASDDWTPSARVVGDAIVRLVTEDSYTQTGDHALIGRFRKLVDDGLLESEGNLCLGLRDTRVRRPPGR